MASDLVVRVAGERDLSAVASLRLAWEDRPGRERSADANGEPVGMATLYEFRRMPRPGRMDSRWGYVGNMFVREDCRNRGVGSALIGAVIDAAQQRQYVRVVVSPTVRSVRFYRRAGFVDADGEAGEMLLMRSNRLS